MNINYNITKRKLMLFDLCVKGHHSSYIQRLIEYWQGKKLSGQLDIVVSPKFFKRHGGVVALSSENVKFTAITDEEEANLNSRKSKVARNLRNLKEWNIYTKYAKYLQASHSLLMYFDTCGLPLAWGVKSPCPFSGIYFRPTFHYNEFTDYQPSWKDRLQETRERFIMSRILGNNQLQTLFCLDPFAVKHLNKFNKNVKAVHLPDPVEILNSSEIQPSSFKENLGVEPGRRIFLLFGTITARKGIYQLLESLLLLPSEVCQKLCLLIVGESEIQEELEKLIANICQVKPIQIIRRYEFIPDSEIQTYFQLTDFVLAPYQRHVGMSGILLLGAAALKPVLSSNYGLMGEMVQRNQLGLTVDTTKPEDIASGLTRLLLEPAKKLCNYTQMSLFAQENSVERFASVIFEHLGWR
ncbi:putative N-acetylglucosaminyltransferase [Calothrix sp. NIES-4071]|nr:putative N-acetylglucosaminyltransferase [Calothrix sp. NIES-4071]BAZ57222.1 putative N-acetylglucosaminyltransferase [Calothrix sp. NIES-4105]